MAQLEGNFLQRLGNVFNPLNLSKKHRELLAKQRQANLFLEAELYNSYFDMLGEGYKATPRQNKFWQNHISQKINIYNGLAYSGYEKAKYHDATHSPHGSYSENVTSTLNNLNMIAQNGIEINSQHYIDLLSNILNKGFIDMVLAYLKEHFPGYASAEIIIPNPLNPRENKVPLVENFLAIASTERFSKKLMQHFVQNINNIKRLSPHHHSSVGKEIESMALIVQYLPSVLFKGASMEQFLLVMKKWHQSRPLMDTYYNTIDLNTALHEVLKNYYSAATAVVTVSVPAGVPAPATAVTTPQTIERFFDLPTLPPKADVILHTIQEEYNMISQYNLTLSSDDQFTINNLMEKRIPEVIEKFLAIPPDFQTSLTNSDGYTAEHLMLESLQNFNNKIHKIVQKLAQNQIQDLSAIRRYSSSI